MKKSVCFVAGMLAGSAWAALPSNVIYRNDFTTRESAEAIPRIGETSTFGETGVDSLHALVDNISITKVPGFAVIIR